MSNTDLKRLFGRAVGLSAQQRDAFLSEACAGDAAMRADVEQLLAAHDGAGNGAGDGPGPAGMIEAATQDQQSPAAPPADRVGRYKLLQPIGEGGFGTVYMAEQEHPVRRKVALKIIKLGMDTKQVVARFEAERQALAMMDHPNIAKVLDAGATETGRPYFVMELVKGVPITEYCDQNNLSTDERLALFVQVCNAVQHAHQKGIIHRDLKPTNVLVTMHDGVPVPKVIDFGIAKATNARLTEKTLFTEFRQMVGTPAYMSPEQAEMSGLDVDTRSDIYSLGVLLYELLTGTTPFDPKDLRDKAYAEIQRLIRESEPPRPSTRLSTMGQTLAAVAAHRRSDPRRLSQLVRGELDWIVMKCLEKDRTRRYETANGLAMDVKRHLGHEPVLARPATAVYRLRKFAARHRAGAAAGAGIAAALLVGLALATAGFVRARAARDRAVQLSAALDQQRRAALEAKEKAETAQAQAERDRAAAKASEADAVETMRMSTAVISFLQVMFASARPDEFEPNVTVREILDRGAKQLEQGPRVSHPRVKAALHHIIGMAYEGLGRGAEAEAQLRKALAIREAVLPTDHPATGESIAQLGMLLAQLRRPDEAIPMLEQALPMAQKTATPSVGLADLMETLAHAYDQKGRSVEAESLHRQSAELRTKLAPNDPETVLANKTSEASIRLGHQDFAGAERLWRDAIDLHRRQGGRDDRGLIAMLHNLGLSLALQGRNPDALAAYEQALAASEKLLGRDHPEAEITLGNYAGVLRALGREDEARAAEARKLGINLKQYDAAIKDRPDEANLYRERGATYCRMGKFKEGLADADKAIALDPADHEKFFFASPIYLYLGDVDGYHRVCREMVQRFQNSDRPEVCERTVKAAIIEPDGKWDMALFSRLIDRTMTTEPTNGFYDWFKTTQGLFEYRRGNYDKAVAAVEGLPENGRMHAYGRALAGLVLAMAQAKSGKPEEARQTLQAVEQRFDALRAIPGEGDLSGDFSNWFTYEIVLKEARTVVGGRGAPPPPQ